MRKIRLLSLLLVLAVTIFSSCEDKDNDNNNSNTNTVSTSIITELKNYTGKTSNEFNSAMLVKGFTFSEILTDDMSIYKNANNTKAYIAINFNDTVIGAIYAIITDNKTVLLSDFENNYKKISTYNAATLSVYEAGVETENDWLSFDTREEFLPVYNQYKNDSLIYAEESLINDKYILGTSISYYSDDEDPTSFSSIIGYINFELAWDFKSIKLSKLFKK